MEKFGCRRESATLGEYVWCGRRDEGVQLALLLLVRHLSPLLKSILDKSCIGCWATHWAETGCWAEHLG
ncbi:hypothetical protein AAHA92_25259 [Salvia divinorum]|uniref:Uncharacterized protein n=1 Tax=Salvia divinorum TaxID=28513 RepID=A0ABD1GA42_SALDI